MALTAIIGTVAAAGVGLQVAGTAAQTKAAEKSSELQQQQISDERQVEAQRQQAMELDARRKLMDQVRAQQRVHSLSLATATAQGAQFGSGLPGAYGQASGQAGTNILGIDQSLQIGRNIFGINSDISNTRIGLAQQQANSAFGAGLSSLGGTLVNSAALFGKLFTPSASYNSPSNANYASGNGAFSAYNPGRPGSLY